MTLRGFDEVVFVPPGAHAILSLHSGILSVISVKDFLVQDVFEMATQKTTKREAHISAPASENAERAFTLYGLQCATTVVSSSSILTVRCIQERALFPSNDLVLISEILGQECNSQMYIAVNVHDEDQITEGHRQQSSTHELSREM